MKPQQTKIKRIILEIGVQNQWICVVNNPFSTEQEIEIVAKEVCPKNRRIAEASVDNYGTALIRLF